MDPSLPSACPLQFCQCLPLLILIIFPKWLSKLNELGISCSTTNTLNLFGGQNLTENPTKPLTFSVETGTISRNSHTSWVPWSLNTSVQWLPPFLYELNLRNTWQPTSICKNYVTYNEFQASIRTPFEGVSPLLMVPINPTDIKTVGGGHLCWAQEVQANLTHRALKGTSHSQIMIPALSDFPHTCTNVTLWGLLRLSLLQLASVAIGKSSQKPDLGKHILHLSAVHLRDTEQGAGRQEDRDGARASCQALPLPHRLQKLPHPHRGTHPPRKPNFWAAAENPIKSNAISNLLHHGKIHTPPSNPKSLKGLFLYSSPCPQPKPPPQNF